MENRSIVGKFHVDNIRDPGIINDFCLVVRIKRHGLISDDNLVIGSGKKHV